MWSEAKAGGGLSIGYNLRGAESSSLDETGADVEFLRWNWGSYGRRHRGQGSFGNGAGYERWIWAGVWLGLGLEPKLGAVLVAMAGTEVLPCSAKPVIGK